MIKNIDPRTSEKDLKLVFLAFSPIKCTIPPNQQANRPYFGFVEFETEEDTHHALAHLNGKDIDGNTLHLQYNSKTNNISTSPSKNSIN